MLLLLFAILRIWISPGVATADKIAFQAKPLARTSTSQTATLVGGRLLLIYGPFNQEGGYTGPGNATFDADLRMRNPDWGLRDREAVDAVGAAQGFVEPIHDVPADNRLLVYRRQ